MKELINYCSQPKSYADSIGLCLIQLENDETIDDVIKKYVNVPRDWWQKKYSNPELIYQYTVKTYSDEKTYTGNLVLMNTHQVYLD